MKIGVPMDVRSHPFTNPNWMEEEANVGRQDLPEDVMIIEECVRDTQNAGCNLFQTYDCDERKCKWNFVFWLLTVILPIALILMIVGAWKRRRVF